MKCLRPLYRICGRQALLPNSLAIPLCYDPTENPLFHGGFGDVWKGRYNGRDVAAKVLRVYLGDDRRRVRRVSFPPPVACVNRLTVPHTAILQGGCDMELPSSPECIATVGCDDVRE